MNKDFLYGFVSGTVVGAVGYRIYEQNQGQLAQLIQNPVANGIQSLQQSLPKQDLTIEDLISQKERLEDLIAEKKVNSNL